MWRAQNLIHLVQLLFCLSLISSSVRVPHQWFHLFLEVMRSPMSSQGMALVVGFLGLEPALGVSRRDIHKRLSHWLVNQHRARWRGLGDTQRQAQELISGPSLGAKAKILSILFFNRTQSRAVTGLLTGHNTLRRHLHLLGLLDSPLCRTAFFKLFSSGDHFY